MARQKKIETKEEQKPFSIFKTKTLISGDYGIFQEGKQYKIPEDLNYKKALEFLDDKLITPLT